MASLSELALRLEKGSQIVPHATANAAARADELAARAAREAELQAQAAREAQLLDQARQEEVARLAAELQAQQRAPQRSAQNAAPQANTPSKPQAPASQSAPAAEAGKFDGLASGLGDFVTGGIGNSIGRGLGRAFGAGEQTQNMMGAVGRVADIGLMAPWYLRGLKHGVPLIGDMYKNSWSGAIDDFSGGKPSDGIVSEEEIKKQKKLNDKVMRGLPDFRQGDNEMAFNNQDEGVRGAIDAIPDEEYKMALSQLLRGGDASSIYGKIVRNMHAAGGEYKAGGIIHLPGSVQTKGGHKFALAINTDGDKPSIVRIPLSDDKNSRGGVHHGSFEDYDKKNSSSK